MVSYSPPAAMISKPISAASHSMLVSAYSACNSSGQLRQLRACSSAALRLQSPGLHLLTALQTSPALTLSQRPGCSRCSQSGAFPLLLCCSIHLHAYCAGSIFHAACVFMLCAQARAASAARLVTKALSGAFTVRCRVVVDRIA